MSNKNRQGFGRGQRKAHRKRLFREQGGRCALCHKEMLPIESPRLPRGPTIDHITPLSLGGALASRGNLRLAHKACNEAAAP